MDANRISPAWAQAYAAKYPAALKALEKHDFYVPDQLKDNGRTRKAKAKGVIDLIDKLKAVSGCEALIHGEIELKSLDRRALYSKKTIECAKESIEAHMAARSIEAFIWKLERGRNGGTHAEIIIPADSDVSGLKSFNVIESREDGEEVASYLCKPADARACGRRAKERAIWTDAELDEQRLAAIDAWERRVRKGSERLTFLRSKGLR